MWIKYRILIGIFLALFFRSLNAQSIHDIAGRGSLDTLKIMIGENPSLAAERNDDEEIPLHFAAYGGFLESVRILIDKKSDVNAMNVRGETPLHYAAYAGQNDVVNLLLDHGADPELGNVDGNSPLYYTVFSEKTETMGVLLKSGLDVNLTNVYGYTALDFADVNNRNESASFLESNGGKRIEIQDPDVRHLSGPIHRILFPFGDVSNIGVSAGDEGVLLVDTGFSGRAVEKLKKTIHEMDCGKLRFVINTHLHRDHIAGNSIAGEGIPIIDYNSLEKWVNLGTLSEFQKPITGKKGRSFKKYYSFKFNGEEIRLIPHPGIHTDADILVHFTRSHVVHMGDLLIAQSFPSVRQKTDAYLEFLQTVLDVFPESTQFISGHGRECKMKDVADYQGMLASSAGIIKDLIHSGKTRREIRSDGNMRKFDHYGKFIPILNINYWIDAVYATELEKMEK